MIAAKGLQRACLLCTTLFLVAMSVVGCGPSAADLAAVDYAPLSGDDWEVSTPEEQGLDPTVLARLYHDAAQLDIVIVVTTDPLHGQHGDRPWKLEKQNLNLVADFIASLPSE